MSVPITWEKCLQRWLVTRAKPQPNSNTTGKLLGPSAHPRQRGEQHPHIIGTAIVKDLLLFGGVFGQVFRASQHRPIRALLTELPPCHQDMGQQRRRDIGLDPPLDLERPGVTVHVARARRVFRAIQNRINDSERRAQMHLLRNDVLALRLPSQKSLIGPHNDFPRYRLRPPVTPKRRVRHFANVSNMNSSNPGWLQGQDRALRCLRQAHIGRARTAGGQTACLTAPNP